VGRGPIAQAIDALAFDHTVLIHDYGIDEVGPYALWLRDRGARELLLCHEPLSGPTDFGEIYRAASRTLSALLDSLGPSIEFTFHLSPGTPAMAAVWILLAKTRFPARMIESSRQHGVREAVVPFDIAADFLPDLLRGPDQRIARLARGLSPEAPEFAAIVHRSEEMQRVVARARRVALRSVPVLIEGESGTGKELLARAIHRASPRAKQPFVAVNCGAISPQLIESELFGYEKGAFTGAGPRRKGYFEAASGGTLLLDELGELPAPAQVKLLRVLQEGQVVRVGGTAAVDVDVRIIAATHRTLIDEVSGERFRADLFYRLAVAVLKLPPLRDRRGDLSLLIDTLLKRVNEESGEEPGYAHKRLSVRAKNLLLSHPWPGNVRELLNTLQRAALWSAGDIISPEDIRDALLPVRTDEAFAVLNRPFDDSFSIHAVLSQVSKHYLRRALDEAHGNKTKASEMLGLSSYQTLTNWLRRHGLDG